MSIKETLLSIFKGVDSFNLKEAYAACNTFPEESVRARIYENLGIEFEKIGRGLYRAKNNDNILLLDGCGRSLKFLKDESVHLILTDHPYNISKSNKGGNRNFANYECFQYNLEDFREKARVLKSGCFLIEFLPAENEDNYEYLYELKKIAAACGLNYYCKVPWKKGRFVSNTGRKAKNTEDIMIFCKGKARALRPDKKKDLAEPNVKHFMSGTRAMLPTEFDYPVLKKSDRVHQSEKPVELIEAILEYVTFEGDIVLDQFAGSGVVGEACLNKNRFAILIEKCQEFVTTIQKRLNLTQVTKAVNVPEM